MSNTKNKNSNLPLGIIGLVLVAALVGGWWFYSNSKASPRKTNSNSANSANKKPLDDAALRQAYNEVASKSPGAQPANMLGSPTATVTVEEFADFQCPTCATVHSKMKEINALYSGRIKFVFRNFPLTQMHKNAYDAAVAAEAAGMQGKFWAMQDQLFNNQKSWSDSQEARKMFEEYAQKIGLDAAKFQNDMLGLPVKTRVDADLQRGRALNLTGTPTIYVNGKQVSMEQTGVEMMRQVIDAELQKSSNQSQPIQPTSQTVNPANQSVSAVNNSQNSVGNSKDKK
ncbi:MAG: DsbA family protein [Acidobacteriota bacterium]|nr:DsbA family protein [Acidobacteriota bacterium]